MFTLVNQLDYPLLDISMMFATLFFFLVTFPQLVLSSCLLLMTVHMIGRCIRNWREKQRVDPDDKHVLITGCDTGFGFHLARVLDRKGYHVIATCLVEQGKGYKELQQTGSLRMRVLPLDVSSQESVDVCLNEVKIICGENGLWAVVNNAATMLDSDVEILDMDTYKKIINVNTFGMVQVCKAFLPLIRMRKGRVLNVTSVRSEQAVPSASGYITSKFAAEGFSESLLREMRPFGVDVITIRPGRYGLETGQYLPENVERLKAHTKVIHDKASYEVKEAYGEEYLETFLTRIPRARATGEEPIRRVLDVFESAISCVHPDSTYLIDTTNSLVDKDCLVARLRRFLPVYLLDAIYLYFTPIRKEAFLTTGK